jgi:hypothetical protein
MATPLKHFKSHETPTSTKMLAGLFLAPTVQAIVVDRGAMVTVNP